MQSEKLGTISACVVTGVAARRITTATTGLETTTRGRTTIVPTAEFHEEAAAPPWQPPRRRYIAGFCARASYPIHYRSADSAYSSYEDAPPGASDSCRSVVVATPTSQNFRTIESRVSTISSTYIKCAFVFLNDFVKIVSHDGHACRGRSLVVHPCFTIYRCALMCRTA